MKVLDGRGAVVTGGSRGIGRAIVERSGHIGGRALGVQADLAVADAVDRLMAAAAGELDGLDIVVHNAAADVATAAISDTSDQVWDLSMNANAMTAFRLTRHAARTMRDGGRILHISTLNTTRPAPGNAPYAASKGAIEQLTKVAALELGPRQITVNAICPGATDTELLRRANPSEALAQVAVMTPLGRLGRPEDIADVVGLLACPDSRWITGHIINVAGGLA